MTKLYSQFRALLIVYLYETGMSQKKGAGGSVLYGRPIRVVPLERYNLLCSYFAFSQLLLFLYLRKIVVGYSCSYSIPALYLCVQNVLFSKRWACGLYGGYGCGVESGPYMLLLCII